MSSGPCPSSQPSSGSTDEAGETERAAAPHPAPTATRSRRKRAQTSAKRPAARSHCRCGSGRRPAGWAGSSGHEPQPNAAKLPQPIVSAPSSFPRLAGSPSLQTVQRHSHRSLGPSGRLRPGSRAVVRNGKSKVRSYLPSLGASPQPRSLRVQTRPERRCTAASRPAANPAGLPTPWNLVASAWDEVVLDPRGRWRLQPSPFQRFPVAMVRAGTRAEAHRDDSGDLPRSDRLSVRDRSRRHTATGRFRAAIEIERVTVSA